jgi:radical SAM protein with 4Fe4S-binding SPASM domain
MDRGLFAALLPQLAVTARVLHLHVMGEPLMHPHIGELLGLCHEHGCRVNLVTNGWRLAEHADMLLNAPAVKQLSISAHSLLGNNSPPDFDSYCGTVAALATQARRRGGLGISLRIWARGSDTPDPRESALCAAIERAFALDSQLSEALRRNVAVQLAENVHCNPAPVFEWPSISHPDLGSHGACLGLREQCAILVDGTVVPCCLDRDGAMALGNVNDESLESILAGERAARIREGFGHGVLVEELCRRCSYRARFGRR